MPSRFDMRYGGPKRKAQSITSHQGAVVSGVTPLNRSVQQQASAMYVLFLEEGSSEMAHGCRGWACRCVLAFAKMQLLPRWMQMQMADGR
ncbi:hypothetical protein E4U55_001395 [Claviceps digitariae]|nr:hypothetical protein E4U55_001395 [Claviceps digitariae]